MSTHSTDGREWAKLSDLKHGDKIIVDDGFEAASPRCIKAGTICEVFRDEREGRDLAHGVFGPTGGLYVPCGHGQHHLDGQLADDGDHLIGFWPAPVE